MKENAQGEAAVRRRMEVGWRHPAVLLTFALAGAMAVFVLQRYYLKCYSDPLNWLTFAKDLGTTSWLSKLPIGYAFFLHLILPFTGKYGVFLSNLAVLIVLFVLAGLLARRAADDGSPGAGPAAAWALPAAFALLLSYEPGLLVYLTNPYRDPLSYLLMAGSLLLFVRATRPGGAPDVVLACSGVLLGFAICVRETSLIVAPWMALYGLLASRRDPKLSFWRSAFVFGLFLFIGVLPLMMQAAARTGQMFVPPQVAVEGHLPGLHLVAFPLTFPKTAAYLVHAFGFTGLAGLALGVGFAIRRRNLVVLSLLLPAALSHFLLYSFYYTLVHRYLFSVPVLAMPVAAYGWLAAADALAAAAARRGRPWRRWPPPAVAAVALAALACLLAFSLGHKTRMHIRDARRLERDLRATVPPGTRVVGIWHLCQILAYCGGIESHPTPWKHAPGRSNEEALWQGIAPLLGGTNALWFADVSPGERPGPVIVTARRVMALEPVADLPTADYHLGDELGRGRIRFYRAQPWTNAAIREAVPPPPAAGALLCVNARSIWDPRHEGRTRAVLRMDGRTIAPRLHNGANYIALEGLVPGRAAALELESDGPLPATLQPFWVAPGGVLPLKLNESSEPWNVPALLGRGFIMEGHEFMGSPAWSGEAELRVPAPAFSNTVCLAELKILSRRDVPRTPPIRVSVRCGRQTVWKDVDRSSEKRFVLVVPPDPSDPYRTLILRADKNPKDREPPDHHQLAMLISARVHLLNRDAGLNIDVGEDGDGLFLGEGFHNAERDGTGVTRRWTNGDGTVLLPSFWPSSNLLVRIVYEAPGITPAKAGLRVAFNGIPVELRRSAGPKPGIEIVEGPLPPAPASATNRIDILSTRWSPLDLKLGNDARPLGIYVDRIELVPAGRP